MREGAADILKEIEAHDAIRDRRHVQSLLPDLWTPMRRVTAIECILQDLRAFIICGRTGNAVSWLFLRGRYLFVTDLQCILYTCVLCLPEPKNTHFILINPSGTEYFVASRSKYSGSWKIQQYQCENLKSPFCGCCTTRFNHFYVIEVSFILNRLYRAVLFYTILK